MSRDQSTEWAEAMTAATATRWVAGEGRSREPAIKRVAAPFAPPVSAHRGDAYNGHHVFIADGWDRYLFCGRLEADYSGRGWIERATRDLSGWLRARVRPTQGSAMLAGALAMETRRPWTVLPIRLPSVHAAVCAETGLLVTVEARDLVPGIVWPDGASVELPATPSGEGLYQRIAEAVATHLRRGHAERPAAGAGA